MTDKNCKANALLQAFESIARKRGIFTLTQYPALVPILASPCDCGGDHSAADLKKLIAGFDRRVRFIDGFVIAPHQAREAFEHLLFDGGSIVNRRNYVITVIFGIDPDSRRGWDQGTFKRLNQPRLLLAIADYLLDGDSRTAVAA